MHFYIKNRCLLGVWGWILLCGLVNLKYECVVFYEKHITPLYLCVRARAKFVCSVGNY